MNREDSTNHQPQVHGPLKKRKHNRGGNIGSFKPPNEQAAWRGNQNRKQFRGGRGWHKSQNSNRGRNKYWRSNAPSQEQRNQKPPQPKPIPPPPVPFLGSAESFQLSIQTKSRSLLKQMAEYPDGELALPTKEDTNDNILPGIRYLQAVMDSTASELNNHKKNEKKAAQRKIQQDVNSQSVLEIVRRVRELKRQARLNVSREIRNLHDKERNIEECSFINTIIPDLSVRLNVLPDEFVAELSKRLNIDLEPLPNDADGDADGSTAAGNVKYDPFDCDNSTQEPPAQFPTYHDNDVRVNNFDDDSLSRHSIAEMVKAEDHVRSVKCHIKPGRAEERPPSRFKLIRDLSSNSTPLFGPLIPTAPQKVDEYDRQFHCRERTPPPPQISGTQRVNTSNIRVIKEANEVYRGESRRECFAPLDGKPLAPFGRSKQSDVNANGYHRIEDDEILFRQQFDMSGPDDDNWNRNIIVKSKERVLREMAEEARARLGMTNSKVNNDEAKENFADITEVDLRNGHVEEEEEEERIIVDKTLSESSSSHKPLQTQEVEVLDYEEEEEESQNVEDSEQTVDNSTKDMAELTTENSDINLPESPKDSAEAKPDETHVSDTSLIEPPEQLSVAPASDANLTETPKDAAKVKQDGTTVIMLVATNKPGTYKFTQKGKLSIADASEIRTEAPKPNEVSEGIQTEDLPVATEKVVEEKTIPLLPKTEPSQSHHSDRKRKHSRSKTSSTSKHTSSHHYSSNSSKSKSDNRTNSKSRSVTSTSSAGRGSSHKKAKTTEVKTKNQEVQTDTEPTSLGRLREQYNRLKHNTKAKLKRLNVIHKKFEDLLSEHREICKGLNAFHSTSESEEETAAATQPRRRLSETDVSPTTKPPTENETRDKKKQVKVVIISADSSAPSKKNPVLNSDTPSEQVLTKVLHNDPEDHLNPDSPPNFLMHSMDEDIFSMISEPRNKAPLNEPAAAEELEIQDEQFADDSNPVTESEATEMEIDSELGGVMNISETMPADILEPSDNECMGDSPLKNSFVKLIKYDIADLQRMKHNVVHKSADEFSSNNNVKIEETELCSGDVDVGSEFFGSEVQVNATDSDGVLDYIGWKDSILVIKIVKDLIVAGDDKGKLYYFGTQSAYPIFTITLCSQAITSMILYDTIHGPRLFVGSLDSNLYVFDVEGKRLLRIANVAVPVQCIEMAWLGLYLGSAHGDFIKYCLANGKICAPINISQTAVLAIRCAMDGARRVLVVATRNEPITIRDASNGLQLRTIGEGRFTTVFSLVLYNNRVYCGTSQDDVLSFNFHNGQLLYKHSESGGSGVVCMTTVRNLLFAACYNGKIYVYDTTDNSFIASMKAPSGLLLSMAIVETNLIAGTKLNFQCLPLPESVARLL